MYLSFDPGGRYTGFAQFTDQGDPIRRGTLDGREALFNFLEVMESWLLSNHTDTLKLIIEDFEFYPHMRDKLIWNKFEVIRTIGIIEGWAYARKIPQQNITFQKASIKSVGYMWVGLENKHKHDEDAYVHGMYYLINNKIRSPVV